MFASMLLCFFQLLNNKTKHTMKNKIKDTVGYLVALMFGVLLLVGIVNAINTTDKAFEDCLQSDKTTEQCLTIIN